MTSRFSFLATMAFILYVYWKYNILQKPHAAPRFVSWTTANNYFAQAAGVTEIKKKLNHEVWGQLVSRDVSKGLQDSAPMFIINRTTGLSQTFVTFTYNDLAFQRSPKWVLCTYFFCRGNCRHADEWSMGLRQVLTTAFYRCIRACYTRCGGLRIKHV